MTGKKTTTKKPAANGATRPTTKPKPTAFRAGSNKQTAFETFKSEHAKYEGMTHEDRRAWRDTLAKKLKLAPVTIQSWIGGQFKQQLTK